MKRLLLIAAGVFLLTFLANAQAPAITQVELTKQSRGYNEAIRITPDSVFVMTEDLKNGKPAMRQSRGLVKEDWTKLVNSVRSIKLKDVPSLPSPTMNRASDGAMHATITITTNDGKSYAHGYDDENPHPSLQEVRRTVREVSGKKE